MTLIVTGKGDITLLPRFQKGDFESYELYLGLLDESLEEKYQQLMNELPKDYIQKMVKGIVAFEIEVDRLEGKYKLSQNKTENEQKNIVHSLEKSEHSSEKEIAEAMKQNLKA